jgi:hypothetical protein
VRTERVSVMVTNNCCAVETLPLCLRLIANADHAAEGSARVRTTQALP